MSMVNEGDLVLIFHSLHRVMQAEQVLLDNGEEILLIPVPRQLSSDCGMAIRVASVSAIAVRNCLAAEKLLPQEVYQHHADVYYRIDFDSFSP